MNLKSLRGLFKKKVAPKAEPIVENEREHLGQGARKAARRKFRHALQNKLAAELRNNTPGMSPKMGRFLARVKADSIIAYGSPEPDTHGRSLVRA